MAKLVPFKPAGPTRDELHRKLRELAADTGRIDLVQPHFRDRLRQRGITIRQVLDVLREGEAAGGPKLDDYGDWRIKVERLSAGRKVRVWVVVQADRAVVVTVY